MTGGDILQHGKQKVRSGVGPAKLLACTPSMRATWGISTSTNTRLRLSSSSWTESSTTAEAASAAAGCSVSVCLSLLKGSCCCSGCVLCTCSAAGAGTGITCLLLKGACCCCGCVLCKCSAAGPLEGGAGSTCSLVQHPELLSLTHILGCPYLAAVAESDTGICLDMKCA